ncbi:L,D-transpeptidase [Nocardia callitridis]|uniref:L,D-TPase catalytic domain-containing protein n=1 Tax=Nocardia callitridis TaxID=648753 RepID=A0ABP9KS18_9NOCA
MLAGIAAAGLLPIVPAQAEPIWPGGPDIPGVPALIPPLPVVAPCSSEARACLRLGTNEAWLMRDGKVTYGPTQISHGRPGYETPPGVFAVFHKNEHHWSTLHNSPMPYAVFFNGDIGFHEGPVQEASHGCIRMTHDGASTFFRELQVGDVVEAVP